MTLIAAAQSCAHPADLPRNLDDHLRLMRIAQARGVRLLVFPELSLTGYEPSAAAALAQPADTPLLQPLRQLAEQARMTTVVGLPLRSPKHAKPLIAALILGADGSLGVYAKQHLHAGEERHFSAGDGGPLLEIDGLPMALAVCADFSQPSHPAHAARAGARLYIASALIGATRPTRPYWPVMPASTEWACCWPTMAGRRVAGRRRAGVRFGMSGERWSGRRRGRVRRCFCWNGPR